MKFISGFLVLDKPPPPFAFPFCPSQSLFKPSFVDVIFSEVSGRVHVFFTSRHQKNLLIHVAFFPKAAPPANCLRGGFKLAGTPILLLSVIRPERCKNVFFTDVLTPPSHIRPGLFQPCSGFTLPPQSTGARSWVSCC